MAQKAPDGKGTVCVVSRYGLMIRGHMCQLLHIVVNFLWLYVALVSIVEDYLSAEDHTLSVQF